MADDINKVVVSGRLGADPEIRFGQSGKAVLSMRLCSATSFLDKDKQRKERQAWLTVKVFGPRAEGLAKFLQKGHYLVVEGAIETGSYDDRDGNKRHTFDIVASSIVVPPRGDRKPSDDSAERPSRGYGGGAAQAPTAPEPGEEPGFGEESDIPFAHQAGCGPWRV